MTKYTVLQAECNNHQFYKYRPNLEHCIKEIIHSVPIKEFFPPIICTYKLIGVMIIKHVPMLACLHESMLACLYEPLLACSNHRIRL